MLFWHLGGTVAFVRYAFRDERMDLRFLMLGAILPNLIDTPVGLLFWDQLRNVRLVSHALVFGSVLMISVLVSTRRGRPRKRWMPIAIGVLMHLFLDAMWQQSETLWWPFLGWSFTARPFATAAQYVESVVTDWRMWALEAVGLAYLAMLAWRSSITSLAGLRSFARTGVASAPIDRS